jgi:hypothetical protein
MTADNGPLMEKIRKYHLRENQELSQESKAVLLLITDLFQHSVLLLHRWARALKPGSAW